MNNGIPNNEINVSDIFEAEWMATRTPSQMEALESITDDAVFCRILSTVSQCRMSILEGRGIHPRRPGRPKKVKVKQILVTTRDVRRIKSHDADPYFQEYGHRGAEVRRKQACK